MPTDQTSHARREGDIRLPSSRTPVGARHPQLRVDLRAAGPVWTAAVVSAVDGIIEVMAICLDCDLQRCPRCQRQLLSCGCPFDELDGEGDGELEPLDDECGSASVIPIFYGRSTPVVERLAAARQIELAGRSFGPDQ